MDSHVPHTPAAVPVPSVREVFALSLDSRQQPYGLRHRYELVEEIAPRLLADDVRDVLRGDSLERILGALLVVPSMARTLTSGMDELLAALIERVGDATEWTWSWGEHPHQRRVFGVATLAVEGIVALLNRRVRLHRRDIFRAHLRSGPAPEPADLDVDELEAPLMECLRRALDNREGHEALRGVLRAVRQVFSLPAERRRVTERMAEALVTVALDPARFGHVRWMAAVELDRAVRSASPEDREVYTHARERALRGLSNLLDDPATDIHLRRHMRQSLAAVAPELVAELLGSGRFSAEPLPDLNGLLNRYGSPIEARVHAAALLVTTHAVLEGLASDDPAEILAAAALAPVVAGRGCAEALARALLANIDRNAVYDFDNETRPLTIDVGTFAAERLLQIISADARRSREPALSLLLEGVTLGVRRGLDDQQRPFAPVSRFLDAARWSGDAVRPRILDHLRAIAANRAEAAEARFVALLLDRSEEANAVAAAILGDTDEDPALRALIGTRIYRWAPKALHTQFVDPEAERWVPVPSAPPLPVSDPAARVPMAWLVEALVTTTHLRVRHGVIRSLGSRLGSTRLAEERRAAMLELQALDRPALRQVLRDVVDDEASQNVPRWSASICLAAFGSLEDHERLVQFAALKGAWSRLDPESDEFANSELLDHLTLVPLAWEDPHSMLEPYLRLGYGEAHGNRIMAQVFALLGHRALQSGQVQQARVAFNRASALDPLNLAARRAARMI